MLAVRLQMLTETSASERSTIIGLFPWHGMEMSSGCFGSFGGILAAAADMARNLRLSLVSADFEDQADVFRTFRGSRQRSLCIFRSCPADFGACVTLLMSQKTQRPDG